MLVSSPSSFSSVIEHIVDSLLLLSTGGAFSNADLCLRSSDPVESGSIDDDMSMLILDAAVYNVGKPRQKQGLNGAQSVSTNTFENRNGTKTNP